MSVTAVYPNLASAPQTGRLDERSIRRYRVTWFVETDDVLDGPQIVGDAPGLPRLFSIYRFGNDLDLGATCKSIDPQRVPGEQMKWEVTFEYDSTLHREAEGNRDPLLRPPEVEWDTEAHQAIATHDINGNPLLNSAKDEFDPPAMKDDSRMSLTITRNESTFQVALGFSYLDAVNSDAFFGFAPLTAKVKKVRSRLVAENNSTHWRSTYVFHFRNIITSPGANIFDPETGRALSEIPPWNITILDLGFCEITATGKKRIKLNDGTQAVQPIRLDGSGNHLAPFDAPRSASCYFSFQVYPLKPFVALGLP